MELSVIIPTYNRTKIIYKTIQNTITILKAANIDFEIIIVNDGNEDIKFNNEKVKIYKNKKKGVASARNLGFESSTYNYLLFLDDDILITHEAIQKLLEFFNSKYAETHCMNIEWIYHPSLLEKSKKTNFGRYLIKTNYVSMKGWMGTREWKSNEQFEIKTLASYFLAITRNNFLTIGGYNEKFPYSGFEDYEFAKRAASKGIKTILDTTCQVFHNEEDRLNLKDWLSRRYREGITRATYFKLTKEDEYDIKHPIIKKIIYEFVFFAKEFFILLIKSLNYRWFDFITYPLIKLLTGSYIWKGFKSEKYKKD